MATHQTGVSVHTNERGSGYVGRRLPPTWAHGRTIAVLVLALLLLHSIVGVATKAQVSPSAEPVACIEDGVSGVSGIDEWLTIPLGAGIVRVTGDGTGHDLTGGRVREVEIDEAGTIWVAQGRRIIALGRPGAIEPRALGWQALPRRLSVTHEGELLAEEEVLVAGGRVLDAPVGRFRRDDR